jgi:hypothetical protein
LEEDRVHGFHRAAAAQGRLACQPEPGNQQPGPVCAARRGAARHCAAHLLPPLGTAGRQRTLPAGRWGAWGHTPGPPAAESRPQSPPAPQMSSGPAGRRQQGGSGRVDWWRRGRRIGGSVRRPEVRQNPSTQADKYYCKTSASTP